MSRIHEALRRAVRSSVARRAEFASGGDVALRRPADWILEQYPHEEPSADRGLRSPARERELRSIDTAPRRTDSVGRVGHLDAAFESKLVVGRDVAAGTIEQYRRLAASLHELQAERGLKTLAVTSALPREGKTLTVVNLALTLSRSYARRVLLIDADLRRPSVHEPFGLPNTTGLGNVLRSERDDLPLVEVSPLLTVLTAGPQDPNPTAGLASDRMRALLEESASRFDWILLDTPPVGVLTDAQLLARLTRAVIFVICAGVAPYRVVDRALAEVGRECVIGTVLNRIKEHTKLPGYYGDFDGAPEENQSRQVGRKGP